MNNINKNNTIKSKKIYSRNINALRDVITAENAVVNSVSGNSREGFVTITYRIRGNNQRVRKNLVTLLTGRNTRMRDQFGDRIGLRDLQEGMVVTARFSSMMTRSNPPQSQAYSITVVKENEASMIDEGRVLTVDFGLDFDYLLTGNANNINSQMRYVISDSTLLRDRRGNRIRLRDIRRGQIVRIERASFQTMSIPPQTNAFTVQIISG